MLYVGCFYTLNTGYAQVIEEYLRPTCEQFKLPLEIVAIENTGSWITNVAEKPHVIRKMLDKLKQDDVLLFLDADARIVQYPTLLINMSQDFEIGYHLLDWNSWYGQNTNPPVKELLSGTMFFRPTVKIKQLCEEWYNVAKSLGQWEQKALAKCVSKYEPKTYYLPIQYCYINSLPNGDEPKIKCDPVIIHYQKSRELKRTLRK